jgi:type I restriction enzyme R subunit
VVEAKRKGKDAAGAIEQAKRYSRGYTLKGDEQYPGGPWGDYKIPFLFATNGRPYLRQIKEKSGVWFLDARQETNHSRALEGWYTPEGLTYLLQQDIPAANARLETEPMDYLPLRDYQEDAIRAVEQAVADGQCELLLAMATGTNRQSPASVCCTR